MPSITAIRPVVVNATVRTNWIFVIVETDDGRSGVGEATLDGHEAQVLAELDTAATSLVGSSPDPRSPALRPHPGAFGGLAHAAARSAIEQATWDLLGQRLDAPIVELLGGPAGGRVRAYANVNRGILDDRSPEAFAAAVEAAVADGFDAVKIAPFDGLRWQPETDRHARSLIDAGLARIAAVRAAVGPDVEVMIDCHGRFDARTAIAIIPLIDAFAPSWIEDPVPGSDLAGWRRVRDATSSRLAGGEALVGLATFRRFIEASGVDVVLADVKWCGGIAALSAIADLAEAHGIALSPHNPSGPVSTAATAHVALAMGPVVPLVEVALGEADWRVDLVGGGEAIDRGSIVVGAGPGLGLRLDEVLAARHPFRESPVSPELWER